MTPPTSQTPFHVWNGFVRRLTGPIEFFLVLCGVAAICFGIVDWRVNRIVTDPKYIAEVASRVRPSVVFDIDSRVLADTGALKLLQGPPEVRMPAKDENGVVAHVIIRPRSFLRTDPILEAMDMSNSSVEPRRTSGIDWEITVSARYNAITDNYEPKNPAPFRFRLELVP